MMNFPLLAVGSYMIIVKRGEAPLFLALAHFLESADNVDLIWDRRIADRPRDPGNGAGDGRPTERRRTTMGPALALIVQHDRDGAATQSEAGA
jgi:hypothetical protein